MFPKLYASLWGVTIAVAETVGPNDVERWGFGGLTVLLIYWITNRLSRQMDAQTETINKLSLLIERLYVSHGLEEK